VFIGITSSKQPVSLVLIPVTAVLLWLPGFFLEAQPNLQVNMPLYGSIEPWLIANPFLARILGLIIVILTGFSINYVVNEHQIAPKKSWLPALLYVTMASSSPGLLWLHPALPATFLVVWSLHLALSTYRDETVKGIIFHAGVLAGLATLIYLPSVLFILFLLVALIILRPFNGREWAILFSGSALPFIYSGFYFFMKDSWHGVTAHYVVQPVINKNWFLKLGSADYAVFGMVVIIFLGALYRYVAGAGTSTMKTKKSISVISWMGIFSALTVLPAQYFHSSSFLFLLAPLTMFATNYFIAMRKPVTRELVYVLLIGSIIGGYLMRNN
jgi:hypothetical protein